MSRKLPHGRPRGRAPRPVRTLPPHRQRQLEQRRAWQAIPPEDQAKIQRLLNGKPDTQPELPGFPAPGRGEG